MTIAALLARAKETLAADAVADSAFEHGAHVTNGTHAGRVAFVEDGWVYWVREDGRVVATRPSLLRSA